jgi:hypothetical protein
VSYLSTSWSRVLIEKLTGLQLAKKFFAFYGTVVADTVVANDPVVADDMVVSDDTAVADDTVVSDTGVADDKVVSGYRDC